MHTMIRAEQVDPESRILYVDDGSKDKTWAIISEYAEAIPYVDGVKLAHNRGHQNALLAGLMTASNCIGFVGGMRIPTTLTKYSAYLAAAQKVNPSVKGVYNFEAGFTDASAGVKLTESWIGTDNVDVMWCDASAVDGGVRQALENAGADSHFNIAQPIDSVGPDHPCVITSTVTDWMMGEAMDAIESGTFGDGKIIEANIDNGGVYLGKFSDKVPADVQSKVEEYTEQIKADTFITDDEVAAIKSGL